MNHIQKAIKESRRVWHFRALPLDTYDEGFSYPTRAAALRSSLAESCEHQLVQEKPATMWRRVGRHNRAVSAYLRPEREARERRFRAIRRLAGA